MDYQPLPIKYRPLKWSDLIGQPVVVKTMTNMLEQKRIAHSVICSGSRGTGKTTVARILARVLNCNNRKGQEPCLICDSCQAIGDEESYAVHEMDAASHGLVDDVRKIKEEVNYVAMEGNYRVYIIDECFHPRTDVLCVDGKRRTIRDIVEDRYSGEVWSVSPTGNLEPRKITNWWRKDIRDVSDDIWAVKIQGQRTVYCTSRHEWFVSPNVKVQASKLSQERVLTRALIPSVFQQAVYFGTLLGDSTIRRNKSEIGVNDATQARFTIKQGDIQKEYLHLKYEVLQDWAFQPPKRAVNGGFGDFYWWFNTKTDPWFTEIWDRTVIDGRKRVTPWLCDKLTPAALAVWFMDDGSSNNPYKDQWFVSLHTQDFSKEEVQLLSDTLKNKFDVDAHLCYGRGWFLNLTAEGSTKFFNIVRDFIPSCMSYKCPDARGDSIWNARHKPEISLVYRNVQYVKRIEHPNCRYVYDIEVEGNHNFIVGDGSVVSNCHALTNHAWQAFLKTLEEPPSNVIFVFCTTESHKIPDTIISRSLVFQFNRISVDQIVQRLKYVCGKENIRFNEDALRMIAMHARGGMRDALTLLDQSVTFSSGAIIDVNIIKSLINACSTENLISLFNYLVSKNLRGVYSLLDSIYQEIPDMTILVGDLSGLYRQLMLAKMDVSIDDATPDHVIECKKLSSLVSLEYLVESQSILHFISEQLRLSYQSPRHVVEVYITKLLYQGLPVTQQPVTANVNNVPVVKQVVELSAQKVAELLQGSVM